MRQGTPAGRCTRPVVALTGCNLRRAGGSRNLQRLSRLLVPGGSGEAKPKSGLGGQEGPSGEEC